MRRGTPFPTAETQGPTSSTIHRRVQAIVLCVLGIPSLFARVDWCLFHHKRNSRQDILPLEIPIYGIEKLQMSTCCTANISIFLCQNDRKIYNMYKECTTESDDPQGKESTARMQTQVSSFTQWRGSGADWRDQKAGVDFRVPSMK